MGVKSVVDRIETIFSKKENFDESGFAYADLVTPELAEALGNLGEKDVKRLERLGYGFNWFDTGRTDGIIFKTIRDKGSRKAGYVRRMYFNQVYPFDNYKEEKDGQS